MHDITKDNILESRIYDLIWSTFRVGLLRVGGVRGVDGVRTWFFEFSLVFLHFLLGKEIGPSFESFDRIAIPIARHT